MCLLYAVALLLETDYPNQYGWSLLAFCSLLGVYLVLWQFDGIGPLPDNLLRQATAQKIVVYSQVVMPGISSRGRAELAEATQGQRIAFERLMSAELPIPDFKWRVM